MSLKTETKKAFTLAEVLIVIGIIGVISAFTIPVLMNKIQNHEYKVAYKKAYSDISNAFSSAISNGELTSRTNWSDAVASDSEWEALSEHFKKIRTCNSGELSKCWADGEKLMYGQPGVYEKSFIDT